MRYLNFEQLKMKNGPEDRPAKILVVDDEKNQLVLIHDELVEAGYEVITSQTGKGLLNLIVDECIDLVVLDIKMQGEYGLDILQDIRNRFYDLPVIMHTAYDTFKGDQKSIAADYYVVKGFDKTELKQRIAMALDVGAAGNLDYRKERLETECH